MVPIYFSSVSPFLLLTFVFACSASADIKLEEAADQDLVGNPSAKWALSVETNHSDRVYMVGERLSLTLSAPRRCYIQILNVAPNGDLTVLWPLKDAESKIIEPDRPVVFPDGSMSPQLAFVAREPVGKELIVCLATTSKIDFNEPETKKMYADFFDSLGKVSPVPLARLRSFVTSIEKNPDDWAAKALHVTTKGKSQSSDN